MSAASPQLIERIRSELDEVHDPCSVGAGSPLGLDAMGLVKDIRVENGRVVVDLRLTSPTCLMHGYFIDEIDARLGRIEAVEEVEVRFDTGVDWDPTMIREDIRRLREERLRQRVAALNAEVLEHDAGGAAAR
jgi:metal-sulfur cluster biosynthetic enzyme